jgi:hypothetical protein
MEIKKTCACCRHKLDIGVDAIRIDTGVIGMEDFVPMEKTLFFCSENCIRNCYNMDKPPIVSPKTE